MPEQARLRVHGYGKVEVELVTACLADLRAAYESILVFTSEVGRIERASREFPYPLYPFWNPRFGRYAWEAPSPERLTSFVSRSQRLVLNAVQLSSPGVWEFLGSLNPLEVIRKWLNDRHERRKDREYRESAELRRLTLENLARENAVIEGRVKIARDLGATDADLAPFLNDLLYKPLLALDRHQDRGIIGGAELLRLEAPPDSDERDD